MSALYEAMLKSKNRKSRRKQIAFSVIGCTAGAALISAIGYAAMLIISAIVTSLGI